jgi:succinoglycan biosynthesis protein ExoM
MELTVKRSLVIGVLSYNRHKAMFQLLGSLSRLELPSNLVVSLVIVDNHPQGQIEIALQEFSMPFPVEFINLRDGNISRARNAILNASQSKDFVCFFDDDVEVDVRCVANLLATQSVHRADVVVGNNVGIVDFPTRIPVNGLFPYRQAEVPTGSESGFGWTTANCLLSMAAVKSFRFDESLGPIGGSDTEFFFRLSSRQLKVVYCAEALSRERFDRNRCNLVWIIRRTVRSGCGLARAHHLNDPKKFDKESTGISRTIWGHFKGVLIKFFDWNMSGEFKARAIQGFLFFFGYFLYAKFRIMIPEYQRQSLFLRFK